MFQKVNLTHSQPNSLEIDDAHLGKLVDYVLTIVSLVRHWIANQSKKVINMIT